MLTPYLHRERAPGFVRILVLLVVWVRLFSSSASQASEAPRVVLISVGEPSALGERVRAELAAMSFASWLDAGATPEPTLAALADLAQARGAVAAVALTFSREGMELWVVERATGQTRLRSFVSAESA
ncbi:MAG TPA: hypothetical protein VJU61_07830, partial [Polyangiaceae bacterium]|nr:hypothetical protein [Polyangiaceae bacterium]